MRWEGCAGVLCSRAGPLVLAHGHAPDCSIHSAATPARIQLQGLSAFVASTATIAREDVEQHRLDGRLGLERAYLSNADTAHQRERTACVVATHATLTQAH